MGIRFKTHAISFIFLKYVDIFIAVHLEKTSQKYAWFTNLSRLLALMQPLLNPLFYLSTNQIYKTELRRLISVFKPKYKAKNVEHSSRGGQLPVSQTPPAEEVVVNVDTEKSWNEKENHAIFKNLTRFNF